MQKVKPEVKTEAGKKPVNSPDNEAMISQMSQLQHTLGNQKVQELIRLGALPAGIPDIKTDDLKRTGSKRNETEKKQLEKDREALRPEIEKIISEQKSKLDTVKKSVPGKPVYANVTVELVYVTLPSEKDEKLYHYMTLKKADISIENVNRKKAPKKTTRGETVEETYSYVYDENKDNPVQPDDTKENPERELNAEETAGGEINSEKPGVKELVKEKTLKK